MTLDELKAKIPAAWHPVIDQYGAAVIAMSVEEVWAWVQKILDGKTYEAWLDIYKGDPSKQAWAALFKEGQDLIVKNAEKVALQKQAGLAVLRVLLTAVLALVGL